MPTQVVMPQLGESVSEGVVSKWLKTEGDRVNEFDPLLEINTDKVDTEIPSPVSGTLLKILANEGQTIQVGGLLGWIGEPGEDPASAAGPTGSHSQPRSAELRTDSVNMSCRDGVGQVLAPGRDAELGFISPVVARIAGEHHIDLHQIKGTGQGGRITKKDVLDYLDQKEAVPQSSPQSARRLETQPAPAQTSPAAAAPHKPAPPAQAPAAPTAPIPGEVLPLTAVRRAIAEHMVHSKHTSPHVTTIMEVDFSRVAVHRSQNKEAFARDGVNLTYTAYIIAAIATGLKAYPLVNSSWSEAGILIHRPVNIGMATSLGEAGLIVPVIKNADGLSLLGMARTVNDLANRARSRQLQPDEVKGGTFTLTNHGISGSLFATPIINQPQCAILGVGAIQKRIVVITDASGNDTFAIRPMAYISLTFDHRILDGAIADHFLGKVVQALQDWSAN